MDGRDLQQEQHRCLGGSIGVTNQTADQQSAKTENKKTQMVTENNWERYKTQETSLENKGKVTPL